MEVGRLGSSVGCSCPSWLVTHISDIPSKICFTPPELFQSLHAGPGSPSSDPHLQGAEAAHTARLISGKGKFKNKEWAEPIGCGVGRPQCPSGLVPQRPSARASAAHASEGHVTSLAS